MCRRFVVIGLSDSRDQRFDSRVADIVANGKVFSGGRRHRDIVERMLPADACWIELEVPVRKTLRQYEDYDEVVVFASGDPLFSGFASTLKREFPDAGIEVWPSFNSIQTLCHRIGLAYHDMVCVTLTGRDWKRLDSALIAGASPIGVLTDRKKTPGAVARRLIDYGYISYDMTVGENLGNEEKERVSKMTLIEATECDFEMPNCLVLEAAKPTRRPLGIPEEDFEHLEGRRNMITKMPIRLLSLSMLDLHKKHVMWDIGFCTGSVSIEARLRFPHLDIVAFERRAEGVALMETNSRRFGAPGITSVTGDFMQLDLSRWPHPDAVFIGGHGGRLEEMVAKVAEYALPGCTVVFNSVSQESLMAFASAAESAGMHIEERHLIAVDDHNPITVIKAIKPKWTSLTL